MSLMTAIANYPTAQDLFDAWIRELNFKTEFKALIGARCKAISNLGTYRVVHTMCPNQVVCYLDRPELANEVET